LTAERTLDVRNGRFKISLLEGGSGPPLLYLHGTWALDWNPFLERLAARRRVLVPRHPGFGESSGDDELLDLTDLVYFELDQLDQLGLRDLPLIGHGLGGMFAAELAAVQPERFSKLVLIAPLGLWNVQHPVPDFFTYRPPELAAALFYDQSAPAAVAAAAIPTQGDEMVTYQLERAKSLAATARYIWPIPNRGLSKRIHRVRMPTLLVWGANDAIVPPAYAEDFRALLPDARVELIEAAGHLPMLEQPERLAEVVEGFLEG
jgi:pimeloyl-ACP methyl ester carboxylesterase